MAESQQREMTADEFLIWNLSQDIRYELVDGFPVPLRAMSGASTTHDRVASNLMGLLFQQLRKTPCWATTPDVALRTAIKRVRRPDVTIECAPPDAKSYESRNPVAVFEILSPSTRKHDRTVKLAEYMRHPSLRTIVHIDPDSMEVVVFSRDETNQWLPQPLDQPEQKVVLAGTVATLTLAEIYEGVPVTPGPGIGEPSE